MSGQREPGQAPLAGKSTLNWLGLGGEQPSRYKKIQCRQEAVDQLLVDLFLEAQDQAPVWIVLDLDVTDLALHGQQEGRFFHGYYDEYCYLPLYILAGEHLLCARLRTADQDAAAGSTEEVKRIVGQIRKRRPEVPIVVRADSGFCCEELMAWCQNNGVGYVLGLARNERLRRLIAPQIEEALRRLELRGTGMERAQAVMIRERLLRIGAPIRITVWKIWLSMASGYPWQGVFRQVWAQLRC